MKFCIIDNRADKNLINNIEKYNFEVILMPPNKNVSVSCKSHPDISLCRISQNELIYSKECENKFLYQLEEKGIRLIEGNSGLSKKYPCDIKYNAAIIGNYLIHKLENTDSKILEECEIRKINKLNVNQGYTCCSTAIVRDDLAITSDAGIYNAIKNTGEIDVLLVPPQKNISLVNADYGFIGGASGRMDDNNFALAGKAELLDSYYEINGFLEKNQVRLISLTDEKPFDMGTLMFFTL